MILILGKDNLIKEFITEYGYDYNKDITYVPDIRTHHSAYSSYEIDKIKKENKPIVATQNKEMIEALIHSDLKFIVITVREFNGIVHRIMSKDALKRNIIHYDFEARD